LYLNRASGPFPTAFPTGSAAPMAVTVSCPGCRTTYPVAEDLLGKKIRCKKCQETFTAAAPKAAVASTKANGADERIQAKPAVRAPANDPINKLENDIKNRIRGPRPAEFRAAAVEKAKKSAVLIKTHLTFGIAYGSGWFAEPDGIIVTNSHVVGMKEATALP